VATLSAKASAAWEDLRFILRHCQPLHLIVQPRLGKRKLWIMGAILFTLSRRFVGMVAGAVFSNVALAQVSPPRVPDGPWHMMHDWSTWGAGGMWFGPLIMIAWLAVLVAISILNGSETS
jgi:hypothetical protein